MRAALKATIKAQAHEAHLLKQEERKRINYCRQLRNKLKHGINDAPTEQIPFVTREYQMIRSARIDVLRRATRHNLLAYGFLRGKSRREVEGVHNPLRQQPFWRQVFLIVWKNMKREFDASGEGLLSNEDYMLLKDHFAAWVHPENQILRSKVRKTL